MNGKTDPLNVENGPCGSKTGEAEQRGIEVSASGLRYLACLLGVSSNPTRSTCRFFQQETSAMLHSTG